MKRHNFKPFGGMKENPGVWDIGNGGLRYVDRCDCGVMRERGKDYTSVRPSNNWGPIFYDAEGKELKRAGSCRRATRSTHVHVFDPHTDRCVTPGCGLHSWSPLVSH